MVRPWNIYFNWARSIITPSQVYSCRKWKQCNENAYALLPGLDFVGAVARLVAVSVAAVGVLGVQVSQDGDGGLDGLLLFEAEVDIKVEIVGGPAELRIGNWHWHGNARQEDLVN